MSTYLRQGERRLPVYEDICPPLRDYLQYLINIRGLSIRSVNGYYVDLRLFLRFIKSLRDSIPSERFDDIKIGDVVVNDIIAVTEDDILAYMYFLVERGNEAKTRCRKLSSVKGFFSFLHDGGRIPSNPSIRVKSPKTPQREPKYLTLDEARRLQEAAANRPNPERDACITVWLLHCGMRLSELCSINLNDISKQGEEELYTLRIVGKGDKERTVYLNDACMDVLGEYLLVRQGYGELEDKQALFVSKRTRRRLTPRAVEKIIEAELFDAKLSGRQLSVHKLRHTAATLLYDGGADLLQLKEILGHEHTTTTEIYTHLNNRQLRAAVENHPLNAVSAEKGEHT